MIEAAALSSAMPLGRSTSNNRHSSISIYAQWGAIPWAW